CCAAAAARYRGGWASALPSRSTPTGEPQAVVDLGSRQGDGAAQTVHGGHRRPSILLRSPKSVAARFEREHQRPAAAVLSEGNGSDDHHAASTRCRCTE